jgi:toxin ParE1/3/4
VSRRLVVRPDAEAELTAQAEWYEDQRRGLGQQFVSVIEAALSTIEDAPETWPYWQRGRPYRKYVVQRFPFIIFFTCDAAAVNVVAVAHAKRRPGYWLR